MDLITRPTRFAKIDQLVKCTIEKFPQARYDVLFKAKIKLGLFFLVKI